MTMGQQGGDAMRKARIAQLITRAALATAAALAPAATAWAHSGHPHVGSSEPSPAAAPTERLVEFEAPPPGTYQLPVIKPAPDGAVLDARGISRRLHQVMAGKVVVLSFVY